MEAMSPKLSPTATKSRAAISCTFVNRWHDPHERHRKLIGLASRVTAVYHLSSGVALPFEQTDDVLTISDLPEEPGTELFPVVRVTCDGAPTASTRGRQRLWGGDPLTWLPWAAARGEGPMVNGGWPNTLLPQDE